MMMMRLVSLLALSVSAAALNVTCVGDLDVTFKTGAASCGNSMQQGDVQSEPSVGFPGAEKSKLYLFVMVDPDACLGDTDPCQSWTPGTTAPPGKAAPVRHWVVGNIYGETLREGRMATYAEVFTPFKGPAPPSGAHRYGFFVWEQQGEVADPQFGDNRTALDYEAFLREAKISSPPVASNWIIVHHST